MPEDFPPDFEFHAYELFQGIGCFEKWEQPKRFFTFEQCMKALVELKLPVIYGAVDKLKLAAQIYKSANPLDVSFRLCVKQIQAVMRTSHPDHMGLLIADSFDDGKKRNLKSIFRENRKKFVVSAMEAREAAEKERILSDHFKSGQRLSLQNRPTKAIRNVKCFTLPLAAQANLGVKSPHPPPAEVISQSPLCLRVQIEIAMARTILYLQPNWPTIFEEQGRPLLALRVVHTEYNSVATLDFEQAISRPFKSLLIIDH